MADRISAFRKRFTPISEEAAERLREGSRVRSSQEYAEWEAVRQAEWERKQREEAQREAAAREAERAERLAADKAETDAFNAARAREDAQSPFGFFGPQNTGRDIRICLAKLGIDVWYDELTKIERIDGLDDYRGGERIDKQTLGALFLQLSNEWPKFKPTFGLLERTVRAKARDTERNGVVEWLGIPEPPKEDTELNSWLISGFGAADTPLNRAASRAWMIDTVRCARQPGLTPNIVLAFEGYDPHRAAIDLSYDYPPLRDFLLSVMLVGRSGARQATRRLVIRCGRIDINALHDRLAARWNEAVFHAAAGESVDLVEKITEANDASERATNPFVTVLDKLLDGVEGKIRTVDVIEALGLDPAELANNRHPYNGMLNRAMELLGWGNRRAVRWQGGVVKGWSSGASTLSLEVERTEDGCFRVKSH